MKFFTIERRGDKWAIDEYSRTNRPESVECLVCAHPLFDAFEIEGLNHVATLAWSSFTRPGCMIVEAKELNARVGGANELWNGKKIAVLSGFGGCE
jgi:hypothetical protein